jgi:hypothetical protein
MQVAHTIKVAYQSTNDADIASEWLNSLPELFSADLETAIWYTKDMIEEAKLNMLDEGLPKRERVRYQSIAKATALGHPSHCTITHCSIAYSEKDAYVFIIDSKAIADVVLDFLTTTTRKQVWHNYSYDGRFLMYYADKNAINIEDTQILAKTLVNHVEVFKAKTGLKDLMGAWYGDWGISADNFTIEQQYEEHVLKYAAIDACATYKLWFYLNDFIKENTSEINAST